MRKLSSSNLLRAAAIVTLLYGLGHMSGIPWTPGIGPEAEAVVRKMQDVRFEAMGRQRSYWDFYFGFGMMVGLLLVTQAAILWWLARIAVRDVQLAMPLIVANLFSLIINTYLCQRYFFALPTVFCVLIFVLCAAAGWAAYSQERATP